MPEQMASIVEQQGYPDGKLCLHQDRSFFEWRYSNSTHKYIFYFLMKGSMPAGYVVVDVGRNNQTAAIIDYAQVCDDAVERILRSIIRAEHFVMLSIFRYGLDPHLSQVLTGLGFSLHVSGSRFTRWQRGLRGLRGGRDVLPLLIRPVREVFSEQEFIVHGLDVRDISNWVLKPVCSDSA